MLCLQVGAPAFPPKGRWVVCAPENSRNGGQTIRWRTGQVPGSQAFSPGIQKVCVCMWIVCVAIEAYRSTVDISMDWKNIHHRLGARTI